MAVDMADVQDTFLLYDNRGDGQIEAKQIGEVVRALGLSPTEAEIKKFGYQNNPEERIRFETFYPIYQNLAKQQEHTPLEEFTEAFRVFDKEQNGYISAAEVRHLLTALGEKLTDEEVDQLLSGMENSQGMVNYEDFVRAIASK